MANWTGRVVSKVELLSPLGRGGMAEVYAGRHSTLGKLVAVKVLHEHLMEDTELAQRFLAEAKVVAGLRHPNIVQVLDFDVLDERPYIVMEMLDGISLKQYLNGEDGTVQRMPLASVVRIIEGVAAALDYAHGHGIVHRDVKPANIMLRSERGEIKPGRPLPADVTPILTDFGIARLVDSALKTASGQIVGTPAYMSPEQVRGEAVDYRTDIYSLGIVLFEMAAGVRPYEGESSASVLVKHITDPVPALPLEAGTLQPVLDRALAKDPARRYQKAADMVRDMRAALEGDTDRIVVPALPLKAVDEHGTHRISRPELPTPDSKATARSTSPYFIGGAVLAVIGLVGAAVLFRPQPQAGDHSDHNLTSIAAEGTPVGSGDTPAQIPAAAAGVESGTVIFQDNLIQAALEGAPPPPDGQAYQAWLLEPDADPLRLGVIAAGDETASLAFEDGEGQPALLDQYSQMIITVEEEGASAQAPAGPTAYEAALSPELIAMYRTLNRYSLDRGDPFQVIITKGLAFQTQQYESHLGFAVDALTANNLAEAKLHAEHVINIVSGQDSPDFGDWDANGQAENPGDGVGMDNYLALLALGLEGGASDVPRGQVEETIRVVDDAKRIARIITAADLLETVQGLAAELEQRRVRSAVDLLLAEAEQVDLVLAVPLITAAE